MRETNIERTVLNIAGCCNLRCKDCLAFIPYYKEKWLMSLEEAKVIIEKYFQVVDSVKTFTITGGEPLLNKDLKDILSEAWKYRNQIIGTIDMVTNSTIMIPCEILDFFEKHKEKTRIILSDYGKELSKEIGNIEEQLVNRGITYRISKLSGDDLYYGGWIDFSDHSLKWKTKEERDANAMKCLHGTGKYFVINDGCIHRCSRSYWRMKSGIIPYTKGEYVPLLDEEISLEEKRELLLGMLDMVSSTSCAYCVGFRNGIPRVKPAIQLQ